MITYPGAHVRIVPYSTVGTIQSLGLILHVQQGDNSPYGWFSDPNHGAVSHWWVSKTGLVEQYVDAAMKSWAQVAGNASYHSVETEGFDTEPLTAQQVQALGALYRWGVSEFGWELKLADAPGTKGFGWHGMGGAAWGGHYGCPGDLRKAQRTAVLTAARQGPQQTNQEDVVDVVRDSSNKRCYLRTNSGQLFYIPDGPDLNAEQAKWGPMTDLTPGYLSGFPGYRA